MKRPIVHTSSFRFRRWSRKAYAAFASIGRHVTIGYIHKDIADKSLAKQVCTGTATICAENGQPHWGDDGYLSDESAPPDVYTEDILELTTNKIFATEKGFACRGKNSSVWERYATLFAHSRYFGGDFSENTCFFISDSHPYTKS